MMMNKKKTSRTTWVKYALLIPVVGIFILTGYEQAVAGMVRDALLKGASITDEVTIKGKVVDETGLPLPDVTIVVKGTNRGCFSNASGNFSIKGQTSDMLIFSYVGKESQTVPFKNCLQNCQIMMKTAVIEYKRDVGTNEADEDNSEDAHKVKLPEFPGGKEELFRFIMKSLKYPEKAIADKVRGRVMVSYTIDEQGKVTNAKIEYGVSKELDAEALRIINSMPQWTPGMQGGEAMEFEMAVPINFVLNDSGENPAIVTADSVIMMDSAQGRTKVFLGTPKSAGQLGVPLYVVDGIIMKPDFDINSLRPEDIENLTVLTGGASILIYGDKGKNGAIVITMKKRK